MATATEIVERLKATQGDVYAQAAVMAEFLLSAYEKQERSLLRDSLDAAAVLHWFDSDLLHQLLDIPQEDASSRFVKLQTLSFVESFGRDSSGLFNVHEASRVGWRKLLATKSPKRFRTMSARAAGYFANDPTPAGRIEWIYHLLSADPRGGASGLERLKRDWNNNVRPGDRFALATTLSELLETDLVAMRARPLTRNIVAWARDLEEKADQLGDTVAEDMRPARKTGDPPANRVGAISPHESRRSMPNFGDLIGAFLQNLSAPLGQGRMGSALENLSGVGAPGGGMLNGILGAVQGGLSSAAQNPLQAGGIGAVLGSLSGGGDDSVKGDLAGGALAMLAGVAMKALASGGQSSGGVAGFSGGAMPLGLKAPENQDEERALEQAAALVLMGMINAAKSDGEIKASEIGRVIGKLKESGMDEGSQHWVMTEMSRPLDLDAFAAEIPGQQAAAEVYAASLLAIEVDTEAEREYLRQLAERTGLNPAVVGYIHQTMGVA